jgi:SAM-dependent methyltransferase
MEALMHAGAHYRASNLRFVNASATNVPFCGAWFDLITAFEVIEHLDAWPELLAEGRRLLAPGGQFLVSTPNTLYYAEARRFVGPNPFHKHEFTFEEFRDTLNGVFPHVSMFVQNHADGVVFRPLQSTSASELRLEASDVDPATCHFFVAVCAMDVQIGGPTFVYMPSVANVLREREQHIARLEEEIIRKDQWLDRLQREHKELVDLHAELKSELETRNRWAHQLNHQLEESGARVVQLQGEITAEQVAAREMATAYESKLREVEADNAAKTKWALETEERLTAELKVKSEELAQCVALLDTAERTVEERSLWAQRLEQERLELEAKLGSVRASRWYRMGRRLGLGPEVRD